MATASHLNHPGTQTAPAVAASTVAVTNSFAFPCLVQIFGGTVSVVAVGGVALSLVGSIAFVPAGSTITLTYAVAPTWTWFGLA